MQSLKDNRTFREFDRFYRKKIKLNPIVLFILLILIFGIIIRIGFFVSGLLNHRDADKEINTIKESSVGDVVTFGSFNDKKIEWIVSGEDEEGYILLCSKYCLLDSAYNNNYSTVTWEKSDLRSWLNHVFYYEAFNEKEQKYVDKHFTINPDNKKYKTSGGANSKDYVTIPTKGQVMKYLSDYKKCTYKDGSKASWWLRNPGSGKIKAMIVDEDGEFSDEGTDVNDSNVAVRLMIWIQTDNSDN